MKNMQRSVSWHDPGICLKGPIKTTKTSIRIPSALAKSQARHLLTVPTCFKLYNKLNTSILEASLHNCCFQPALLEMMIQ